MNNDGLLDFLPKETVVQQNKSSHTLKLVYNERHKRYDFICTYDTRFTPKEAGFRWDNKAKMWYTKDVNKALLLVDYADEQCHNHLEQLKQECEQIFEKSNKTNSNLDIPKPEGLDYYPFQRAGIDFIEDRFQTNKIGVLLADEMGLGKSIQTIGFINLHPEFRKILIICPASLKLNWERELDKWLTQDYSISVITPKLFVDADILIMNYELVRKHREELIEVDFDLIVCDEAHYLKNSKAQRTQAVLGKKRPKVEPLKRKFILFLTGTPIMNRPMEIWNLVHFADKETFNDFWGFAKRYCGAYHNGWGYVYDGATHLDELAYKLRSSIMVRREKKEVLSELPDKVRQVVELSLDDSIQAQQARKAIADEHRAFNIQKNFILSLQSELAKAKKEGDQQLYNDTLKKLHQGQMAAFGEMAKQRHRVAVSKVPFALAFIKEILEASDGKLVIFAHHHDVVDSVMSALGTQAVCLTGRDSHEAKQVAVDRFQNDDEIRVFVGGIHAAGLGLTLTASSHVLFLELDWTPSVMSQAEDRLHRIGQKNSVLVQHLVLNGSLDVRIAKQLVHKQNIIDKALSPDPDSNDYIMFDLKG